MEGMVPGLAELGAEAEGEEDEEASAQLNEDMQGALALNAQLKAMLLQAEEDERQYAQNIRKIPAGKRTMPRGAAQPHANTGPSNMRPVGTAKNGGWGGLTHTMHRSTEIDRDNQILVQKLSTIAVKPTLATQADRPFRQNPAKTSVQINRRRKDDQIARENAALARRLTSVKPTSNLSTKATSQHAKKHTSLLRTLGSNASGAGPSQLAPAGRKPSSTLPALRRGPPERPAFG